MEARTTRYGGGSETFGAPLPSTVAIKRFAAAWPQAKASVRTVVSAGLEVRGDLGVVEAGDGQVAGHVEAAARSHGHAGDRHQVVGVDDRGRRLGQVEQRLGGVRAALGGEVGADARSPRPGPPRAAHRPRPPGGRHRARTRPARRRGRSAVAEVDQVLDGGDDAGPVVDGDARDGSRRCSTADPARRAGRARRRRSGRGSSTRRSVRNTPSTRPSAASRR